MWFDKISDHKHDICLCRKLSTKLLAEAANNNTKLMFAKTGRSIFRTVRQNSKQTLQLVEKVTAQRLITEF